MELTIEQQRALAVAQARLRMQQQAASSAPTAPKTSQQLTDEMNLPVPGMMSPDPVQPERYSSPIPGGDALNAFGNAFAENIPVLGPLATRGADAAGSQIASMISGQSPEAMLAQGKELRARDASDNPIADTAGTVAGAVGPLMSLGTTKLGEQALGLTGPLWQRILAGGLSGGAISGADAAARGDDFWEAGGKGLVGAGIGAVSPIAERAVAPLIRMLTGQAAPKATQALGRNLEREGIDPASLMARIDEVGPDAVIADLGPNLQRQAGAIASLPGEGQSILRDALIARSKGTNARIQGDVDATLGASPVPSYLQTTIREGQDALSPAYREALQGASPVDTAPLAAWLDDVAFRDRGSAQTTAQRVRQMLDETGNAGTLSTNPETLLSTRKAIDGMLSSETNTDVLGVLQRARREVDQMLGSAVPGIKQVDAQFAELARQNSAVDTGQQILDSGRTATRPAEAVDMMAEGAQAQGLMIGPSGEAFRLTQGARAEIDRIIGTTGNNLTALKSALKGDGSWNRDRLVTLFGQDKADRLLGILEREQQYAQTFNTVTQNSETAARTAAQKEAAPQQFGQTSTSLADLLLKIPQGAANMGARARSEATNKAIAAMLMGKPTPELVDQLLFARQLNRGVIGSSAAPLLTN